VTPLLRKGGEAPRIALITMKILGIDYGEKRIGLAISDESQTLARELDILSPKEFWAQVNKLISDQQISLIVLGWPLNMSGGETKKTGEVERFRKKLLEKISAKGGSASGGKVESETGLPVEVMDERLSSQMAVHLRQGFGGLPTKNNKKVGKTSSDKSKYVDSLAAQILLQNYLDRNKK
jgi:putative Holliday junction resolvase